MDDGAYAIAMRTDIYLTNNLKHRRALVKNLENGKSVEVVINDHGPLKPGRIADLTIRIRDELECDNCQVRVTLLE